MIKEYYYRSRFRLMKLLYPLLLVALVACDNGSGENLPTTTSDPAIFAGYMIIVSSDKTTLTGDGTTAAKISATVYELYSSGPSGGSLASDGTPITFSTNLGSVSSPIAFTKDGVAEVSVTSTSTGVATVTATAPDGTSGNILITFN